MILKLKVKVINYLYFVCFEYWFMGNILYIV